MTTQKTSAGRVGRALIGGLTFDSILLAGFTTAAGNQSRCNKDSAGNLLRGDL